MDPTALGRYLRESREAKELTLEDAVTALRIRRPILEAFEQGDFSTIETPVQVRGLLRNYARFLDLEEERVLQYYEAAMNPRKRRRFGRIGRRRKQETELLAPRNITDTPPSLPAVQLPENPRRTARIQYRNNLIRNVAFALIGLAAFAVIIFVIVDITRLDQSAVQSTAIAPTTQNLNETIATATFFPTSTSLAPTATLNFAGQGFVGLDIQLTMTQRSWVSITADGVVLFTGMLAPDEVVDFEASNNVEITAANSAAVNLVVNGQEQPRIGQRGQQVDFTITTAGISFNLKGEVSPTPSPTILPTDTPLPTATVSVFSPTPTEVQINTIGQPTPEPNAVQAQSELAPALPSPTSIFADPASPEPLEASPTPLFDTTSDAQADTQTDASSVEASPVPIIETEAGAVLPIRATPANPTPTKSG